MNQEYAKLIEKMIADNYLFLGIEGKIKYSLFHDPDPSITATTDRKTNVIRVNTSFIQEELASGRPCVIEYFVIHEMRHVYQHAQIEKFRSKSNECGPTFIKRWIEEGKHYTRALDENGNENEAYFKQDCELDAYSFSYALMHYKYKGRFDSLLYLPDIYRRELKKEFDDAFNAFLEFFS